MKFCDRERFPFFREQAKKYQPKMIVCTGKEAESKFKQAFLDSDVVITEEKDVRLKWGINAQGTFVFMLPFFGAINGVKSTQEIQSIGEKINQIVNAN